MMTTPDHRPTARVLLAYLLAATAGSASLAAQTPSTDDEKKETEITLEKVEVTGSRIRTLVGEQSRSRS